MHAALGDPVRLAIVDDLATSDRSPVELQHRLGIESNLLAHHLDTLERVRLIERSRSSGDGRRRYVHLRRAALDSLGPRRHRAAGVSDTALFVCSASSARSPLAAALWRELTGRPATPAGTHPARSVHPQARAAAARAGLDLGDAEPTALADVPRPPELVITVCDRAHEELRPKASWLHWSVPDPVAAGTKAAFDRTIEELGERIEALVTGAPR